MSGAIPTAHGPGFLAAPAAPAPAQAPPLWLPLPRSRLIPAPFILATLIAGISWLGGGVARLTDLAFILITLAAAVLLINELARFPQRFGLGGALIFAGVLIWFCYDYCANWLGRGDLYMNELGFTPRTLAKATCIHALGISALVVGLLIPFGRWFETRLLRFPEPASRRFYLLLVIAVFMVGVSPYFLLTSEPWYSAIYHDIVGGKAGGAAWTFERSDGNVNYSWRAYWAQVSEIGKLGGILAVFYALLISRTPVGKVIGWSIWFFWAAVAFGSGSRGNLVFVALPPMVLLYMKYQGQAAGLLRRFSKRAYVLAGLLAVLTLFAVQFQARFRTSGYEAADVREVSVLVLQGNNMFTETLPGFALVPDEVPFFYNRFPGQGALLALPMLAQKFIIGPIPRALWTNKPVDPTWELYNRLVTGRGTGMLGTGGTTTVSRGLIGNPYFQFGIAGVVQTLLLIGWLAGLFERVVQKCQGRFFLLLISLGMMVWLFRCFRGVNFHNLYPVIIGAVLLYVVIRLERMLVRPV